jgi:hypothetical protein
MKMQVSTVIFVILTVMFLLCAPLTNGMSLRALKQDETVKASGNIRLAAGKPFAQRFSNKLNRKIAPLAYQDLVSMYGADSKIVTQFFH